MSTYLVECCCRVCLMQEDVMISIYDKVEEIDMTLSELLENFCDLIIDSTDKYSKLMCEDCTKELLVVAKFRDKCKTSKETFDRITLIAKDNIANKEHVNEIEEQIEIPYDIIEETVDDPVAIKEELTEENVEVTPIEMYEEVEYLEIANNNGQTVQYVVMHPKNSNDDDIFNDIIEESTQTEVVEMDYEKENCYKENFDEIIIGDGINFDDNTPAGYFESNGNEILLKTSTKVIINHNCEICGAGFTHLNNLKRHLKIHTNYAHTYVCDICTMVFHSEEKYNKHLDIHKETELSTRAIEDHIIEKVEKNQDGSKKRMHQCEYCDKAFISNSLLITHIRIHTGERPYKCPLCTKTFTTQGGLDLHTRRHKGVKPFVCSYCNRGFVESSNLKVHLRIHTGEKPHKCNCCGRSFSRVFLLQIHQRTHTGERPYACPICNKAFAQQGDLSAHKRIHTGERPHTCPVCAKGFIKSSGLTSHLRRHEKNVTHSSLKPVSDMGIIEEMGLSEVENEQNGLSEDDQINYIAAVKTEN